MAELNNAASVTKSYGSTRRKPLSTKVDLTAMVDLAFLLITFFMLTTTLAKERALKVAMPVDGLETGNVDERRSMTICLGKNNQVQWFMGMIEKPVRGLAISNYSLNGIRKAISTAKDYAEQATGKHLIVLIKPTEKSNYKNLVDVLDEMEIMKVQTYAISDLNDAEKAALVKAGSL